MIFGLQGRRRTEEEKEDNFWRRKIRKIFGEGKYRKYLEKENIVLQRRRRTKKNKENIWRKNIVFFVEDKKNGDGKGGNYLEKRRKINVGVDRRPTTG